MAEHNILGKIGEDKATEFLEQKGYQILDRNWKIGDIEIDIIAQEAYTIVFVEVKTRTAGGFKRPEEAVDPRREARLRAGAQAYIRHNRINLEWRFDIIGITASLTGMTISHIEDAFLPSCRAVKNSSYNGQYGWTTKKTQRKRK